MNGQKKSVTEDKIVPTDPSRRQAASSSFHPCPKCPDSGTPKERERQQQQRGAQNMVTESRARTTEKEEEETIDRPRKIGR